MAKRLKRDEQECMKDVCSDFINFYYNSLNSRQYNEVFKYNNESTYVYDNILHENSLKDKIFEKKANYHLIEYDFKQIREIIKNNIIDNVDPKPLYIRNY